MRGVLALIAVAVVTAACGADVSGAPTTLRVLMADDWAGTQAVVDVVRTFEADNPGVTVQVVGRPFHQILDGLRESIAGGRPPDVVHHHAFAAGATGLAEPIDDAWGPDGRFDADSYVAGALEDVRWGDAVYGVPLDVNALFMVVDADLGEVPETFADVRRLAALATAGGRRGLTVSSNSWEVYGWIRANGGELVEVAADGTPTFTLDSPRVVEAVDFLAGLVVDGIAHGPVSRNLSLDAVELFRAGDTAMLTTGTWTVAELERSQSSPAHLLAPLPVGREGDAPGSVLGGSSLFVARGSENGDLALDFIAALTDDEVAVRLALEEGRFPPRPALYDALAEAPGAEVLAAQLPSAHPMRLIAFPEADTAFLAALDRVLTGRADAATALADAQAHVEEVVGR
ncbi:ABC transporter substrate-binding protein [Euzebya sp.]|uniref:ABC transporter substrate-binding protein n=1 Tax=Euzebya sp. TaxID=1971409 RepID=UPI0035172A2A